MIKKLCVILLRGSLTACGAAKTKEKREWLDISCSGFADWSVCEDKARLYCPDGYDIGYKDESLIAQKRVMSIACKSPK
jgi:hypothetical protein